MSDSNLEKKVLEARKALWRAGNLEWKLDNVQKEIRQLYINSDYKTIVITMSRRIGKTYTLLCIASEQCIKHPKSIVKFLLPEQKMARGIVRPLISEIFKDAPADVKPQFKTQDALYVFPNGSEIQLAGTDNGNEEKLRGTDAHLCIVDEAGFISADLNYIIDSILLPSMLLTRGRLIMSSTPPPVASHPYLDYIEIAKQKNSYIKKTLLDAKDDVSNKRVDDYIVEDIVSRYPGRFDNPDFKREYLCESTIAGDRQVIPEFTKELEEDVVSDWLKPSVYHAYVTMDIGFKDLTVVLFVYYDYQNGVLVVEDELVMNGPEMTTANLAEAIHQKEEEHFVNQLTGEKTEPHTRVADNNLILINELSRDYGLQFYPAEKHNRDAAIATLRDRLASRQIVINPRCKVTISHLRNATWDKQRKSFSRSADGGHYDAIPALYMLLRDDMIWSRSPFPAGYSRFNANFNSPMYGRQDQNNNGLAKLAQQLKPKTSLKRKDNK